jgi:hypothetical protein
MHLGLVKPSVLRVFVNLTVCYRPENVDAQEEPCRHLRAPLHRGRHRGHEGHPRSQASGTREGSQPSRHEGTPVTQVQGIRQGTVRLEALLLVTSMFLITIRSMVK